MRGGIQWHSSDSNVVRVGPTGVVTAHSPGRAEIVVRGFGQERRAAVLVHRDPSALVVTPRPAAGPLQVPIHAMRKVGAYAEAADSTPIPEAKVTWEVGDTGIVAFDRARGELTGKALGNTTLTARLHGFEPAVWDVQVIPGTLGLDRRRVGLGPGERDSLRAILFDADGKPTGGLGQVEWASDKPEVVRVLPTGMIEGLRPGRATISATAPWGAGATADVFVVDDLLLSSNRGGRFGIYQVRSGISDSLRPLLTDSFANVQPALSPDRTRVAFSSHRGGSYDLYLMDADGRNLRRLSSEPGNEAEPAWTPDGSWIVYTATSRGEPPQLYSLRPDGHPGQSLTKGPGGNYTPAVSADGKMLAFISTRDGNPDVYLMPLEGGEARRLTRTDQREGNPRFLPDGDLIFSVDRGRSKGSRIVRVPKAADEGEMVLETEQPITGLAVSRDGRRVAYVVGRATDASRGRARFDLFVQPLTAGSTPAPVALRPGEQVLSPSF
jgi:hypothetical protein